MAFINLTPTLEPREMKTVCNTSFRSQIDHGVQHVSVAAQVVSGIGFIGAGTIIFQKQIGQHHIL